MKYSEVIEKYSGGNSASSGSTAANTSQNVTAKSTGGRETVSEVIQRYSAGGGKAQQSNPSKSSGLLSDLTKKPFVMVNGILMPSENYVVRNGFIFDATAENLARIRTKNNYDQYLGDFLKANGSKRTGKFGQYNNNFMTGEDYANHELFMSTFAISDLEKQLEEAQKNYEKARISGEDSGYEVKYKNQIKDLQSQLKEYQLDAKAAGEYLNLVKETQAAEEARKKAQESGLNSMDWYDQTKAEYDDIQQQLDDLYDQRRNAVRAAEAEDYSGWATDDLSAANIGGKNKADLSNIEGQIIRLTYQQDDVKKQLGYADRYRWTDVDTTNEDAIALGKATYEQQHQQWTDQMETVSKLPTAGDYGAVSKRMLTLSTSKDYKEPTEDWTEHQKNTYYVLLGDGSDTRRADEFAMNTNNLIQQQKNQAQAEAVGDAATSSFYSGAWRTAAATGAGLASGLEYLGDVQELVARGVITEKPFGLADYNQAVTGSISTYLNNQYGTLGKSAGVLAGKGLGDAYQIAQSVGQSWAAMALTGGSSAAVNVMFFGQAAKQTLDEQLAKGADPYKAVLMGALAGSAEVLGETFSLENIKGLQAGQTKGLLLDILRSAGIEGSEEGVTTLLNTFADRIVNGNDSDYYVALEGYISQGMSYADAERAAMKDWVNGIAYDMIAGAVSGGISGGVGGPAVRAANEVVTGFQEFDGDTKTLLDTAASYKDTKAADLATKYGGQESITVRQAGKLGEAIEKATEQQNERNIHNAISAELKARGVTYNTGDISDAIQKSASGKMLTKEEHYLVRDTPGARAIRDELFDRMTNGKLDAEKLAAEDTPQWLKSIEQKNGAAVAGEAMFGKFQREEAEQRLTEADRIETINPEVTIGDVSGKVSGVTSTGKTAQITIAGQDGKQSSVNLEDALDSGAIPSDVAYLAISAAAFGPAANDVYNLYSPTQTVREYTAAMDAAINTVAANVGSRSAFEQSESVKYLTKEQRDFAWSEGQKQRSQAQENTVASKDTSKKKTQPKEGRVSYGGVTYEGQTFKATTADKVKPEVRRVLEKFAAATGVNIVFYESEADQRGDYVGANGFYRNGTVYLDVHAGAKSTSEKEAVLITAAHEFTHFIRENAPSRYNQLKEFVTEHLLENGYDFETLVERKIKAAQKDGGLSRDAAVEEVVADACEMVLGNSKAIERLAKEKPGLAKRIADWLHDFFADIRKAFEGVEARHEESKVMLDYMDELTKLWDDALVEASENRGETKKGSSARNGSKNSIRESFYAEIDNWDGKAEKTFRVGKTSDILKSIGVRDTEIIWHSKKIAEILRKHTNMTKEVIKQVPKILENPIIVLASKNIDSRLAMFGTVTDNNGKPVTAILELQPTSRGGQVMDFSVIASAYGKDNAKGLVESSGLVYVDPNKNRTESWLQGLGLQLPSDTTAFGSVGRISYPDGKVKIDSIPYTQYMQTGSENVKKSRRDSEGNELSQKQQEFFKDSKVIDERGNLKVMYHGTPNGTFTVFNDGTYFTENKEYADLYQNPAASMLSVKKTSNAPKTYEVYLNIKKPFDIRDAEARDIYINDYIKGGNAVGINPYMSDAEYRKIKTVDWTEGEDLRDFLIDNGYDYDGLILDEGATGGYGDKVKSRGVSYVIFSADQVKNVDNKNPTSDPDIRFSRRDSAEGLTKEEARAQAAAYTRLKAENAELQRRVEYWKGQTQRTKQATVRQTDVNRFARQLIKRYGSTADQAYIRQALQEMGDYLVQNNGESLDYGQLRQMAVTVAAELVATAEATEESSYADDVAEEILSTIRNTDILLDRQYFNDLPEGFRRDFRGKLHVFTDKGRSVDSIYAELQEEYGYDLFPVIDNPADQLVMMGDIFDRLSAGPEIYNPFRGAENEATLSIANEIMDTMLGKDIRQTAPTMKDKADAKVAEVKAEGKQKLDQLRSDKNARIQEIRRQESLRRQEIRAKEKAAKWDKVAEVKAYYQNMQKDAAEKRRENAASKKYRDRVFDKVNTLETWLRKNTDKEHIPEALKEPLIAFLSSIDLTSKQQLKGKGPTQRDIKYTDALQKIKDIVENQAKYLNDPDNANGLDVYLDIPNGFDQSIKDHIESVNTILSGTDLDMSGPVVMMSSDQLKDLDFILTVLTNSIKKINQYITESHFASVMEGARDSNAYMKELGKSRDKTVIGDNAEKFTLWSNTLPYYAFKRFGAAGVERFQALMNGWGKMAMNVQTVMQFTDKTYSADEAKRWEENVRTIDLSDGSQVRMTDAQIMGLWCLARREQGLGHILVGGIRVGDIEPKGVSKKRIRQNDASHLTQDDLNSIFRLLSDRQIEVAKKLQEFLNTTCSEWGNEVSMARFGYRQFTEQFYYPINVDRNNLPMSDPQARETDIFRLLNMSATKALTPNANNSVVINSIFDVFAAHTADMAKYNGLALPILDLLKWYNYKDKSYRDVVDSLGNITTQMTAESVQSIMERTYGKMAQKYVMNFMKDLNGVREGGRNEELLKGMVGKYKAAAVGANLRVAIQQPTSIARAAYVIDPRYLARGMAMKGGINEAMNHSGLAVWKSLGYFDTNIARNMRDQIKHTETIADKVTDGSMKLAELGDKATWGTIWNAAKLEMKETRHLSGDALMKATQERFDEIILATQVIDSTISRSDMMRNQSLAVSEVTSFRSEPTVTYNMLLDSYMDFNMELRKTKSASTAFRRTGGKMVRAVSVYTVTAALTAAAAAIVDAFRDDDDYQTAVEKWIEHFLDNFKEVKEPWRLLPLVDQLYDIFLNNETPDSMLWQPFTQLRKAATSAVDLWKMLYNKDPEAYSRYTVWGKAYNIMQGLSSISGLPVSAAYRDIKAVWNATGALLWPDKKIKFYDSGVKNQVKYGIQDGYLTEEEAISILVESGEVSDPDDAYWITQEWLHADDSEWTRYNDLYAAILAGDKKAFAAAQEALGDHGIPAYSVRIEAKNQIGRLYRGDDGNGNKLTDKQAIAYLMEFAGLGELEAKHLKDEWDLQRLYGLKVSEIGDAYVSGQITRETATDYYIRFGHYYPQEVSKKLLELDCEKETGIKYSMLNDAYIHDEITEQEAQAYLMGYGGLTQAEAEAKTLQWDLAKDYGIKYGSSDEGIKKALTEEIIDQETAITIMETYGGKTHEEAEDYSYQYLFTKETGYNFSEIQQAFEDGVIDEDQMAYWYRVGSIYTHGSEEKAWEYVEVAKWKSEVPGGESMNRTGLDKWYQKSGKLQAQGLGKEDFAKVWTIYSKADAEYDANGNQTKEKAQVVMEQIGQLSGYTKTQLTTLGYAVYSARKVNAYKTW